MSSFTTTTSATTTTSPSPILASPIKKKTMSLTQTYYLAHKARAKLSHEAAMPDHNLRLLVGHANLLDSLMLELADAEREQESWFNQSVRNAQQQPEKTADDRHIQWADTIVEEDDEDDEDDYSDASSDEEDSDYDEDEDVEMADVVSLRRVPSHYHVAAPSSPKMEVVEVEMEDDDEEEDYAELTLTRSPSHTLASSPPELEHDSDESSEDESMPPSPPSAVLPTFDETQSKDSSIATTTDFYEEGFYLPARNPTRLVSQISVY